MICVKIGDEKLSADEASAGWITQQIERRRRDGITVCVEVYIKEADLDMSLATPGCSRNGIGGRPPKAHEKAIFDLWEKCGLNETGFAAGRVMAFLAQLKRLL